MKKERKIVTLNTHKKGSDYNGGCGLTYKPLGKNGNKIASVVIELFVLETSYNLEKHMKF
jgi:hypothetical protein